MAQAGQQHRRQPDPGDQQYRRTGYTCTCGASAGVGRFDQHYQNFCGFESSAAAQRYLAVFEKLYRFTPFSQDAQPAVRGKCPLQLAGYDISQLPMATLCAGLSVVWPLQTQEAVRVPSP